MTGLDRQLSAGLQRWRAPRAVHDPGKIIADLAVAVALGGDCLADIAVLRAAAGPVRAGGLGPGGLPADRAAGRGRAAGAEGDPRGAGGRPAPGPGRWPADAAPGADGGLVTVDIDATIVTAHSEKDQAAPTWKKTFGFHPLTAFADHGAGGSGEPLAIMLRPGNAGSNTAADHIEIDPAGAGPAARPTCAARS